jgi:uncharacterized membrane protein YdbT with pleckstrin-like domain
MSYVNKLLSRNEHIVQVSRDHWITLLLTIIADVAVGIVIVGLSVAGMSFSSPWTGLGLLLLSVPIVHLVLRIWAWWNNQYTVTNQRIIRVEGTLNKRVSDTLLEKVNDIVMEQSALGRVLNFGDIEIISGSESGIDVFHHIADPIGFKKALLDQRESPDSLGDFEERAERALRTEEASARDVPELIAELDELRQKGLITETEFVQKKRKLLDRI